MNKEISDNNKLVIIGNGFDLAHGLKTRYSDFMDYVIMELFLDYTDQKTSPSPFFEVNRNRPRIIYESIESFKNNISQNVSNGNIRSKNSYFNNLLRDTVAFPEMHWINVENHFFKNLKMHFEQPSLFNIEELNSDMKTLIVEFEKYLSDESKNRKISLNHYIQNIVLRDFVYNPLRKKLREENLNINPIHVLNFNYTNTFEIYGRSSGMEINYIHGKLNDAKNPIIFGYGDETDEYYKKIEDIGNNAYLKHFKSFGYFKTENYHKLLNFIKLGKFDVLILGHSCGLSDRVMLKSIFEDSDCEEIQIFYYKQGEMAWQNDFEEKTMEISRHFSNKAEMRKKVRPFNLSIPLTPYKSDK